MDPQLQQAVSLLRARYPDVWQAVHPRAYVAPGWCPAALPAATLALACRWPDEARRASRPPPASFTMAATVASLFAGDLVAARVPTFHVGADVLAAAVRSRPPTDLDWRTQPLPFKAGLFLLPAAGFRRPGGLAVQWLGWMQATAAAPVKVPGYWDERVPHPTTGMYLFGGCGNPRAMPLTVLSRDGSFAAHADGETLLVRDDEQTTDPAATAAFLAWTGVVLNLLLIAVARPELIECDGRRVRTVKAGAAREEWTPNWLGRTYRLPQPAGDGTHASPRLHWRRGHYRRQPCGVGRQDHKIIWLEPVLVGDTGDTPATP